MFYLFSPWAACLLFSAALGISIYYRSFKEFHPRAYIIIALLIISFFKYRAQAATPALEIYDLQFMRTFPFIVPWGMTFIFFQGALLLNSKADNQKIPFFQTFYYLLFPTGIFSFTTSRNFKKEVDTYQSNTFWPRINSVLTGCVKISVLSPFFYDIAWTSSKVHWSASIINSLSGLLVIFYNISGYIDIVSSFSLTLGLNPPVSNFQFPFFTRTPSEFFKSFFQDLYRSCFSLSSLSSQRKTFFITALVLLLAVLYRLNLSLVFLIGFLFLMDLFLKKRGPKTMGTLFNQLVIMEAFALYNFVLNPARYSQFNLFQALLFLKNRSLGRSPDTLVFLVPILMILFNAYRPLRLKHGKLIQITAAVLFIVIIVLYGRKEFPLPLLISL